MESLVEKAGGREDIGAFLQIEVSSRESEPTHFTLVKRGAQSATCHLLHDVLQHETGTVWLF